MNEPDVDATPLYGRIGPLSDDERAWDKQLAATGHGALNWRMAGRNAEGHLVATTVLSCGPGANVERHCTMTFTPAGLVYRTAYVPIEREPEPGDEQQTTDSAPVGRVSAEAPKSDAI